jgi:hypothetical protein
MKVAGAYKVLTFIPLLMALDSLLKTGIGNFPLNPIL